MNAGEAGAGGCGGVPSATRDVHEVHLHLQRTVGEGDRGDDARWHIEASADGHDLRIATLAALLDWLTNLEPRPRGIR
ncbi:MAG: hypothetical protein KF683_21345 [Rubrivivax sp.]|nr:hypothetical protein [Rubrivivax sp.]